MKTRLRGMTPADMPAVLDRLREQNERDGTSYGLPNVFDADGKRLPSIPLALVAVDVETGAVVQGHVWERTVEHLCVGIDPEATVCSMHEQESVFYLLRERGYKDVHILIPPQRAAQMSHGLDRILGMTDTGLRHFYRLLDPIENDALRTWYGKEGTENV